MWETNSSSTHSICIEPLYSDSLMDIVDWLPRDAENLVLEGRSYSGYDEVRDLRDKLEYVAAFGDQFEVPGWFAVLHAVIEEQTGLHLMKGEDFSVNAFWDYMFDHDLAAVVFEPEWLRNFIFNPNSYATVMGT